MARITKHDIVSAVEDVLSVVSEVDCTCGKNGDEPLIKHDPDCPQYTFLLGIRELVETLGIELDESFWAEF
jgi:hypothetical protein